MAILNVFVACLSTSRKLLYFLGILKQNTPFAIFFEVSIRPCLPSTCIESWIDLVKAEVGTSIDNKGLEETVCTFTCVTSRSVT